MSTRALVQAATGTGARRPIELLIQEAAETGSVLVLAPTRSMVEAWAARLLDRAGLTVAVIDSAEVALALLEDPSPRTGQVLLATYARLQHGASRRALMNMTLLYLSPMNLYGVYPTLFAMWWLLRGVRWPFPRGQSTHPSRPFR